MAGKPWSEERKAAYAAKRAAAKPAASKAAPKRDPNAQVVSSVWSMIGVALMPLGRANDAFLADSVVFTDTADAMGDACAELAKINDGFANFLSKGAPATPYLTIGVILMTAGLQVAANHGAPLGPLAAQTMPKAVLVQEAHNRMSQAEAQRAAMQQMADANQAYWDEQELAKRSAESEWVATDENVAQYTDAQRAEPVI